MNLELQITWFLEKKNLAHQQGILTIPNFKTRQRNEIVRKFKFPTILPQSKGAIRQQINVELPITWFAKLKILPSNKAFFATLHSKPGYSILDSIVQLVQQFYRQAEVSPMMVRKTMLILRKVGKNKAFKTTLASNLREAYTQFKNEHYNAKIGFSKFTMRCKNVNSSCFKNFFKSFSQL